MTIQITGAVMNDFTLFEFISYVYAANLTRYVVISGLFYLFFYVLFRKKWEFKKCPKELELQLQEKKIKSF